MQEIQSYCTIERMFRFSERNSTTMVNETRSLNVYMLGQCAFAAMNPFSMRIGSATYMTRFRMSSNF